MKTAVSRGNLETCYLSSGEAVNSLYSQHIPSGEGRLPSVEGNGLPSVFHLVDEDCRGWRKMVYAYRQTNPGEHM